MGERVKEICCFVALLIYALAPVLAQQPNASAARELESQDDDTVRISTKLVQVDGTVTDKDGHEVTDLAKEDFELVVDGRPQTITYFSYVAAQSDSPKLGVNSAVAPGIVLPLPSPPRRLRHEQVQRIIVLAVANVSADSMPGVKKALNEFVDSRMQPGDLVSIIRPAEGAGVLQQLTADKRLLHNAIDRLRWIPIGGVGLKAFPLEQPPVNAASEDDKGNPRSRAEAFRDDVVASSWVRHLDLIVRGLIDLPGRKSVILFSDGLTLFDKDRDNQRTLEALHRITDRATRALIVVNTIDSRGLDPLFGGAAENTNLPADIGTPLNAPRRKTGADFAADRQRSVAKFLKDQEGLVALADETGGRFMQSTDLGGAMTRMLDQKGYYVVGYRPDDTTFKVAGNSRPYHEIKVSVRRRGLQAHFRKGFFGTPDKERGPVPRTNAEKMVAALTSPLAASDVGIRLTLLFGYDETEGSFVRSLLHIDATGLSFNEEADGWRLARLHVLAAAFDENGLVADPVALDKSVRVRVEDLERVKRDGLVFEATIPVKKIGVYQTRVAVRDLTSERIGSASQLIEVPDVKGNQLALSGVIISGSNPLKAKGEATLPEAETQAGPAIRRFHHGMQLRYTVLIINPQIDRVTGLSQLETQVRLYRDGKPVYMGAVRPVDTTKLTESRSIPVTGVLNLGSDLPLGEYLLQVIGIDRQASQKIHRTVTSSIDFALIQ